MKRMNLREAVAAIIGEKTTAAIVADQGFHWAIVAAVAAARTNDNPRAVAVLRKHLADEKARRAP